jgi:hypothetical protein
MRADEEAKQRSVICEPRWRSARLSICFLIFLVALGVRLLSWHDTRLEVGKVQTGVTADYKRGAGLLRAGGVASFLSSASPLSDLNTLGHPPGYSILLALIHSVFGESDTAIQFVQMICDALAAVIILLLVAELLPLSVAAIAGILAALSPQFAWNSVLLLPDSLAVLPILLAVYLLARAIKNPRLGNFVIAGVLIGVSCWLRANAMLLTFFLAAAVPLLITSERRWRYALAVVCGTFLIVLPLTIRNAIVFHRFIPVSLGAGQTLLEGIADYDTQHRFDIPNTDVGIMKQEAEAFHRPDYYGTLFNPDGVERERWRLARGFAVIRSHPFWFAGVMARRASTMLRLERSRLMSDEVPVTHSLEALDNRQPIWMNTATELLAHRTLMSSQAKSSLALDEQTLILTGDDSKYGSQFVLPAVGIKKDTDYVFAVPIRIAGRMRISLMGAGEKVYNSAIVETIEGKTPEQQPTNVLQLPFVASRDEPARIVVSNEASNPATPVAQIGPIKLYELGPARVLWTRYPRLLVHGMQKIFLTAVMLPLAIFGFALLLLKRSWALVILMVVPVYFFSVQSIVHTEYRYVLAVDYFLFAFVSFTVACAGGVSRRVLRFLKPKSLA